MSNFEDRARAEAERQYPDCETLPSDAAGIEGFMLGAEWARGWERYRAQARAALLAAREVTA